MKRTPPLFTAVAGFNVHIAENWRSAKDAFERGDRKALDEFLRAIQNDADTISRTVLGARQRLRAHGEL